MAFTNCNSPLDLLFQKYIRYKHHQENFLESLANEIIPFGLRIKKAPGIVPVTEDFHIKWNEIWKGTERKLIEFLLVESEESYSENPVRGRKFSEFIKVSRKC